MAARMIIGAHVAMAGKSYLLGSLSDSLGYGANAMMIYTGAPQNRVRVPIDRLYVDQFRAGCAKHGIALENVVVHAPYLINLCSGNEAVRASSIELLRTELERTQAIGARYIVLHPGSNGGHTKEAAIALIAAGIDEAAAGIAGVTICLETMAGKGNEIGATFEELDAIIKTAKTELGVCVDTCHMHDADYDLSRPETLVGRIAQTFGLDKVKVVHLNDSKNAKGARKDRHENLGYGLIGIDNLLKFAWLKEFAHAPKILETPWEKGADYYKQEIDIVQNRKWQDFKNR